MTAYEAIQIFSGVMLGDGALVSVRKYHCYFHEGLSISDHQPSSAYVDYLQGVAEALKVMHVEISKDHPKLGKSVSHGKPYSKCDLMTRGSPLLVSFYEKWYPQGKKEVPEDLTLTPLTIAHWFMGDGSSSKDKRKGRHTIYVKLAPYSFNEDSIRILERELHKQGIATGRTKHTEVNTGSGVGLNISQYSINSFMELIDPYVVEPYRYKIKYVKRSFD